MPTRDDADGREVWNMNVRNAPGFGQIVASAVITTGRGRKQSHERRYYILTPTNNDDESPPGGGSETHSTDANNSHRDIPDNDPGGVVSDMMNRMLGWSAPEATELSVNKASSAIEQRVFIACSCFFPVHTPVRHVFWFLV